MIKKLIIISILSLFISSPILAQTYDLRLEGFGKWDEEQQKLVTDESGFKSLAKELAITMSPKMIGPAETLGSMGFEIATEFSFTNINEGASYWKDAVKNPKDIAGVLPTFQIHLKKGIPYSLEIGGIITHLFDSNLWGLGVELKASMQEGFKVIPDFASKISISTILGEHDLAMLIIDASILASKSFGIYGLFSIAPYVGYNFLYANASSHVLGIFTPSPNVELKDFVFAQTHIFVHRGFFGVQFLATYITVAGEVAITGGIQTYTIKAGLLF